MVGWLFEGCLIDLFAAFPLIAGSLVAYLLSAGRLANFRLPDMKYLVGAWQLFDRALATFWEDHSEVVDITQEGSGRQLSNSLQAPLHSRV